MAEARDNSARVERMRAIWREQAEGAARQLVRAPHTDITPYWREALDVFAALLLPEGSHERLNLDISSETLREQGQGTWWAFERFQALVEELRAGLSSAPPHTSS